MVKDNHFLLSSVEDVRKALEVYLEVFVCYSLPIRLLNSSLVSFASERKTFCSLIFSPHKSKQKFYNVVPAFKPYSSSFSVRM